MPIELRPRPSLITRPSDAIFPVYVTLALDPAVSSRSTADASGITVVGNDPADTWWIFEADPVRALPSEVCARLVHYAVRYRPQVISIEAVGAQILYRDLLIPLLEEAGVESQIVEYRSSNRVTKHTRISSLQPRFKAGKMRVRAGLTRLIYELEHYAGTDSLDHDDLIDSLAQHLPISRAATLFEIARRPYVEEVPPSKRGERNRHTGDRGDGCWTGPSAISTGGY